MNLVTRATLTAALAVLLVGCGPTPTPEPTATPSLAESLQATSTAQAVRDKVKELRESGNAQVGSVGGVSQETARKACSGYNRGYKESLVARAQAGKESRFGRDVACKLPGGGYIITTPVDGGGLLSFRSPSATSARGGDIPPDLQLEILDGRPSGGDGAYWQASRSLAAE